MKEMYAEMAFVSYYFHWSREEVMKLAHCDRRKWCNEISQIHRQTNPSKHQDQKNIFALE